MLLLKSAKLTLELLEVGLVLTVLTLPFLAGFMQALLLTIQLLVLLLKILDGGIQMRNLLVELGLLCLECVGLALLVLLCSHQRVDLNHVLLVLLLQCLELRLFLIEADLKQVGFLFHLRFCLLNFSKLLSFGSKILLECLLLVDHLLNVVIGANG